MVRDLISGDNSTLNDIKKNTSQVLLGVGQVASSVSSAVKDVAVKRTYSQKYLSKVLHGSIKELLYSFFNIAKCALKVQQSTGKLAIASVTLLWYCNLVT